MRSRISSKLIFASCVGYSIARTAGFMWPHQGCYSLLRGTKSDSCGTLWVYQCGAVDVYATLLILVRRNIINSSMRRENKWSCITRRIGQPITRGRTVWVVVVVGGGYGCCKMIREFDKVVTSTVRSRISSKPIFSSYVGNSSFQDAWEINRYRCVALLAWCHQWSTRRFYKFMHDFVKHMFRVVGGFPVGNMRHNFFPAVRWRISPKLIFAKLRGILLSHILRV